MGTDGHLIQKNCWSLILKNINLSIVIKIVSTEMWKVGFFFTSKSRSQWFWHLPGPRWNTWWERDVGVLHVQSAVQMEEWRDSHCTAWMWDMFSCLFLHWALCKHFFFISWRLNCWEKTKFREFVKGVCLWETQICHLVFVSCRLFSPSCCFLNSAASLKLFYNTGQSYGTSFFENLTHDLRSKDHDIVNDNDFEYSLTSGWSVGLCRKRYFLLLVFRPPAMHWSSYHCSF